MKTDMELLEELKIFADQFVTTFDLYSYENGGYTNALGDFDIDEIYWKSSESLREEFNIWIEDNGFNIPNTQIDISFSPPSIKVFGLLREIK